MKYVFTVYGKLPSLNEYTSACRAKNMAGAHMKQKAQHICEVAIKDKLAGVHINRPVKIHYTWYEENRRRDHDNVTGFGHKVIQDALVSTNVLKDDGWDEIVGYRDSFKLDKERPRVTVVIEVMKNES